MDLSKYTIDRATHYNIVDDGLVFAVMWEACEGLCVCIYCGLYRRPHSIHSIHDQEQHFFMRFIYEKVASVSANAIRMFLRHSTSPASVPGHSQP